MATLKVKSTTESGLLVGITVVMGLMAVYLPVLGIAANLLWPLPIIVLVVRHGLQQGILSVLASAMIMCILISPLNAVHLAATFGPPSLALGYCFRHSYPASKVLLFGLIASLIGVGMSTGLLIAFAGINPFDMQEQQEAMEMAVNAAVQAYRDMGIDAKQLQEIQDQLAMVKEFMVLLLPLTIICSGLITTWLNFAIGGKLLRRLGHSVSTLPPFDDWHLPQAILYIFGFALVGLYWGSSRDIALLYQASFNVYLLTVLAGFIQGASVLSKLCRNRVGRWVYWVIMVFILTNSLFTQVLAVLGLFDMLFDYRRRLFDRKQR